MEEQDRYHVLKGGLRRGPYTLEQLHKHFTEGRITLSDVCMREGAISSERLADILPGRQIPTRRSAQATPPAKQNAAQDKAESPTGQEVPPEAIAPAPVENEDVAEDMVSTGDDDRDPDACDSEDDDSEDDDSEDDDSEDDDDDSEDDDDDSEDEDEDESAALPDPFPMPPPRRKPPANPATVLYAGRPSLLSYPRSITLMLASAFLAWQYSELSGWILFLGSLSAVLTAAWLTVDRSMRLYLIMPIRLEIMEGLVAKNSREVRIADIRAINIRKTGLKGLLGVGTVEFATAGGDEIDVAFQDVYGADRIKNLVRRLQDHDS